MKSSIAAALQKDLRKGLRFYPARIKEMLAMPYGLIYTEKEQNRPYG